MTALPSELHRMDKDRVARNFSRAAPSYDAIAQFQLATCRRLLERLDVIRAAPALCADLGSGTGAVTRALLARYPRSTTVQLDLSPDMLRAARPRWPWQRRRRQQVCADAESLPLRAECLDLAASNLMLQWCNEPARVLEQVLLALKPGGLLLFTTLGPATLMELRESWAAVDDRVHVNAFVDVHAVGTELAGLGYADMVLETERFTLTYAGGIELMRDLQQLGTGNANAGRNRSLTGKARMAAMLNHYEKFRSAGRLPATYEVIYAHAWRPAAPARHTRGPIAIPVSAIGRRPLPP